LRGDAALTALPRADRAMGRPRCHSPATRTARAGHPHRPGRPPVPPGAGQPPRHWLASRAAMRRPRCRRLTNCSAMGRPAALPQADRSRCC